MLLHLHEWGAPDAPAIVCLHGVTAHGRRFRPLAEEHLAGRFRVLAPDLRGHGRSDYDPPWGIEDHLADLIETTERAGVEAATWLGHSFGGRLVLELAAREPERVERAVLLDPAVWVPPPIALERAEQERVDRYFATSDEAIAARLESGSVLHTPRAFLEEEMAEHLIASNGRLTYRYCRSAVVAAFGEMAKSPPPFERLRLPTLIVRGASSMVVPDVLLEIYGAALGDLLEIVTVPGGHTIFWDAHAETAAAVVDFVAARR